MAEDIRVRGCHAIAINLFDRSVANNRDEAKTQTKAVKASKANSTFATSVDRVKATGNGNGKVATLSWCFEGGCSLSALLNTKLDAAVIYYERVTANADSPQKLIVPLLSYLALWVNPSVQIWLVLFKKTLPKLAKAN